jgi:hypothetical protein
VIVAYRKDLEKKYGRGKRTVVQVTRDNPHLLAAYRKAKDLRPLPPMQHIDFAEATGADLPDWDSLEESLGSAESGPAGADAYEKAIEPIIAALFSPSLMFPERQARIHGGRKRIDITYMNVAAEGFFQWLRDNGYHAPYILVECKNYSGDPANPELDQLTGRFSSRRGRVGFLLCRQIVNKELFIQRCHDTAADGNGYVIPLDDEDVLELIQEARDSGATGDFSSLLSHRFRRLVM